MLRLGLFQLAVKLVERVLQLLDLQHERVVRVVLAQLHRPAVGPPLEPGVRHFERLALVNDRLAQELNVLFLVEDLLLDLVQVHLQFALGL